MTIAPGDDSKSDWRHAIAVYREPAVLVMLFLGFSSGLPLALTGATFSVWLRESGTSLAAIGWASLVTMPYALKFAWAPLIDRVHVPFLAKRFGRRRGWALLTQACLAVALIALGTGDPAGDLLFTAALAVIVAFFSASQDIVIDAFRVESLGSRQQGAGSGAYVLGYRFGMMASGAGALFIAAAYGWSVAYLCMAVLVGVGAITILLVREPHPVQSAAFNQREAAARAWLASRPHLTGWRADALGWLFSAVVAPFGQFMTRRGWLVALAFIAVYKLGDVLAGTMSSSFYVDLGFSKGEIGSVTKVFGLWAAIIGGLVGGVVVSRFGVLRALLVSGVAQMLSNLGFAWLSTVGHDTGALALVVAIENLSGGIATTAFVAYLSGLCDAAYTATQYALLSSFYKLGGDLLGANAGWLAERLGWRDFFVASTFGALPGLLLLIWLMALARRDPALARDDQGMTDQAPGGGAFSRIKTSSSAVDG